MTHKPTSKASLQRFGLAVALFMALEGCNLPAASAPPPPTDTGIPMATSTPSPIPTSTPTATASPTATDTASPSPTPTATDTPAPTDTPTITLTSTPEQVTATALENANCRWGPDAAYLYAAGFSKGEAARVDGKNYARTWLWIQLEGYPFHCWVVASAAAISGNLDQVPPGPNDPPVNPSVPSASGVHAGRSGATVTVTWSPAAPAVDLHYLVQARVCNGQYLLEVINTTTGTSYGIQDKEGCSADSSAKLFVVNKLGYSAPVSVPWPQPGS